MAFSRYQWLARRWLVRNATLRNKGVIHFAAAYALAEAGDDGFVSISLFF